ncbi:MAG: PAS domain S-box protein, partial [Myxococcales bacterium]
GEQTRQEKEKYRALLDGLRDHAFFSVTPDGVITGWNTGGERVLGLASSEAIGRHHAMLFAPEDVAAGRPDALLRHAESEGRADDQGWRVRASGGRFWADAVYSALYDEAGALRGFSVVTRDYSQRHHVEQERLHLLNKLQEAVHARDEFLMLASHELKTPLTAMTLAFQGLQRRAQRDGSSRIAVPEETVATVVRQLRRLTRLVEEMLMLARIHAGRLPRSFEPLSLSELVHRAVQEQRDLLEGAGCALEVRIEPDLPVRGDAFGLEQVVFGLLANARTFGAGRPVQVRVHRRVDAAEVRVRDEGPGIPERLHEAIFERFARTGDPRRSGGLGLG